MILVTVVKYSVLPHRLYNPKFSDDENERVFVSVVI